MTRYLILKLLPPVKGRKTQIWDVIGSDGCRIGGIWWHSRWRQYCYHPIGNTILANSCLVDIKEQIERMMAERAPERLGRGK